MTTDNPDFLFISYKQGASYVTSDGNYGSDDIILFKTDKLTDFQWETLGNLRDSDRLPYIEAMMAGEPLDEWERED